MLILKFAKIVVLSGSILLAAGCENLKAQNIEQDCHDDKVVMLSKENCEECIKAKKWLSENHIWLDEIDIESDKGKSIIFLLAKEQKVVAIPPTVIFFKNGIPAAASVGYNPDVWKEKACLP